MKEFIQLSLVDNNKIDARITDITFFFIDKLKDNKTCIGITFFMFWVNETPEQIRTLINKK